MADDLPPPQAPAVPPPPAPDEPYTDEEDFATGVYELYRAYTAFTAVTGPAASRPLLIECVALTDRLAWSLEVAEADYASAPGRLPYVNQRQEHLIGTLISVLTETDESPEEVVVGLLLSEDPAAQTAAARLLVASAPLYSDKAPPPIFHVLREESAFERLTAWVATSAEEEAAMDPIKKALLVFATGLLAVLLLDRDVADYIVRTPVPTALLKRLHTAPQSFDGDEAEAAQGPLPPFLQGLTPQEMTRRAVLYRLSCLTAMGEYQEVLAPFFQEEGVELVLQGLQRTDLSCRLAAIELTSRLLAHKKFAMCFVQDAAGVDKLVELSEGEQAFQLHAALAMCLFGLASLSNVMEEVCRLPSSTFHRLVSYAISLLRCPQEAAQKSIVLFFGMALAFRPVLQAFDATADEHGSSSSSSNSSSSGLYSLLNLLRSGSSSSSSLGNNHPSLPPPPLSTQRRGQLAHFTTLCLRHHLRVHLAILASTAEADAPPPLPGKRPRLNSQDLTASSAVPSSFFRPVEVDDNATEALLARVRTGVLVLPPNWAPLQNLLHHRGLLVLLGVVASSATGRAGAAETAKYALDCLEMATLLPAAIEEACLVPVLEQPQQRTGMQILLEAASGLAQRDAEVMRGALRVLCNCLCPRAVLPPSPPPAPLTAIGSSDSSSSLGGGASATAAAAAAATAAATATAASAAAAAAPPPLDPNEEKMRRAVRRDLRSKDGIKVLVSLLRYRRCIQAADEVRMLAARALLGLAQEAPIAQILEKMRVSLLLSEVVRAGPVLERAGTEHYSMLRSAALQLIARITGRPASAVSHSDAMDPASWKLEKAAIVTRTSITYDPSDLLHLIYEHLKAQGLQQAARVLAVEAGLRMPAEKSSGNSSSSSGGGMGVNQQQQQQQLLLAGSPVVGGGGALSSSASSAAACAAKIAAAAMEGEEEGRGEGEEEEGMMSTQESMLRGLKSPGSVGGDTPCAGKAKKAKMGASASAETSHSSSSSSSSSSSNETPAKAATAGAGATTAMTGHTPTARPFKRGFADMTSPASTVAGSSFHAAASSSSSFHDPPVSLPPVVRRSSLGGGGGGGGGGGSGASSSNSSSSNMGSTPGPKGGGPGEGGGGGGGSIAPTTTTTATTAAAALPTSTTTTSSSNNTNNSTMQRANRLFPAGLQLRRASRSSFSSSPSPYSSSSLGRKAGNWPTPTPSLLDLPSPFPSTYKLPPLPTTVGHGGPTAYQQQQHHHHLPPVIGSTTLDQIVVQYLRRQHEQCPNPICVLPPFSLTLPHRCPEPLLTSTAGAAQNVTRRLLQREVRPPFGGWKGQKMTRSLVFSRFRPWRSYRDESGRPLTCSVFPKGPPGRLWAGSDDGSVHLVRKEGREGGREGGRGGLKAYLRASVLPLLINEHISTAHPSFPPSLPPFTV